MNRRTLVSTTTAGRLNRAQLLRLLYAHGPLPRTELARLSGTTRATVGQILQPLIDEGVLVECNPLPSTGGKPAHPLWFSDTSWPIGAVHLMPGWVHAALVSAGGTLLATAEAQFPADTSDGELVRDEVVGALHTVLSRAPAPVLGIGIAVGGMVDTTTGSIVRVELAPGLSGLAIAPMVRQALGHETYIDLHPRAQALGDLWFGKGRGLRSFASVYIAEGIGAGFVIDGTAHRGPGGSGGEVGHAFVDVDGELCECGQRGCWNTIAARPWLEREVTRLGLPATGVSDLVELAERNGRQAVGLLERYARNIAVGLANLHQVLAPGTFVLHGDPVAGGPYLRDLIQGRLLDLVPRHPATTPEIVFAGDESNATLLGAACIVLSRQLRIRL